MNPEADDAEAVYANNTEAMFQALRNGKAGFPTVEEFLLSRQRPLEPVLPGSVKITRIELVHLEFPLDPPFPAAWDPVPRQRFAATLVLVDTDEGVRGVGSGDTMDGFEPYVELFVGTDPLAIGRQVRALETVAFHGPRPWPLEAALWDIAGQVYGVPVARLLGGVTDRLAVYAFDGRPRRSGAPSRGRGAPRLDGTAGAEAARRPGHASTRALPRSPRSGRRCRP